MKLTTYKDYSVCILICLACLTLPTSSLAGDACIEGNCMDGQGTYLEASGSRYVGQFRNGTYSGKGVIEYCDGNWYKGDFLSGYRHGQGELKWNGDHYVGGFAYDRYSGQGTLLYSNGNKYEGGFLEGYRHGFGKIEWNGTTYTGDFEYDKWSGKGTLEQANGDKYEGQFKAGYYSGHGTLTYADGTTYEGEFLNGQRHGKGSLRWNGNRYTGDFKNNKFSGEGVIVYADGNRYKGGFLEGYRHGIGELEWNGDRYAGEFKHDKYSGKGRIRYANGIQCEGEFLNGYHHGVGRCSYESGLYEGQWKIGKWYGIGSYTYSDGRTYTGFFNSYNKVGTGTFTWGGDENRIREWTLSIKTRHHLMENVFEILKRAEYDELERIADKYRDTRDLFPDGRWKLPAIYEAVTEVTKKAPEESWQARLEMLERWIKRKPESITAHVALAQYFLKYAFNGRGYSYAPQVTDEGWQLFRERLKVTARFLEKAKKLKNSCPHWWSVSISHAKAAGADRSTFDELLQNAMTRAPLYFENYYRAATNLLPRWNGEKGEWEKFADTAADAVGGPVGDFLYARIIIFMNGIPPNNKIMEESHDIIWPRVKRGLEAISDIETAVKCID
jgi:hypothetical protein